MPTPVADSGAPTGSASAASDELRGRHEAQRLPYGTLVLVLLIAIGALLLRLHNIDRWGMWVDELYSVQHALELAGGDFNTRSLAWWLTLRALEFGGVDASSVGPGEWWTWRAAGITEWNMRAHVALLGAITILVLGLLGRRTFGSHATLWLCLLLALSPWHLWMSQVCRFYMQLFLLYNVALVLYYQATEDGQFWRAAVAVACILLAFFTTPIALMIVGVFAVDIVAGWLRRRPTGMRPEFWALAAVCLALCVAATLQSFSLHPDFYSDFQGTSQPLPVMALGVFYLVGVPMVAMAAFGAWALFRRGDERLAILLVASVLLPLAIFAAFKLAGKDAHTRYTFVALFAWLALAAVGIEVMVTSLRTRWANAAALVPAAALLSTYAVADYIYMTGGAGYRGRWQQAFAYVKEHRRPGELAGGDFVGRQMTRYYLEESDAVLLPSEGFSSSAIRELVPAPAWIVIRVYGPSAGDRSGDVGAAGQLRAYFANHIFEPNHTINVYHYAPPAQGRPEPPAEDGRQERTSS